LALTEVSFHLLADGIFHSLGTNQDTPSNAQTKSRGANTKSDCDHTVVAQIPRTSSDGSRNGDSISKTAGWGAAHGGLRTLATEGANPLEMRTETRNSQRNFFSGLSELFWTARQTTTDD
jgi:hypothetical protein